eukprot:g5490.t1
MDCATIRPLGRNLSSRFGVIGGASRIGRCRIRAIPKFTDTVSIYDEGYELDVIIVGGGLAGLSCAKTLHENSVSFALLESTDSHARRVGGRVKTDTYEGFLLDRGFQIFLTAYPEAKKMLRYEDLELRPFYNGAMVWWGGNFHRVADPFRHPLAGFASIPNPIGSFWDKLRVGLLRFSLTSQNVKELLNKGPESSTLQYLQDSGFSESMVDRFFRPFFGGIFFDNELRVSSRLFEFVMKVLSEGENTLPRDGIGALASQLANQLPQQSIHLDCKVETVEGANDLHVLPSVKLADRETPLSAKRAVVVAVEAPVASQLLSPEIRARSPSKEAPGVGTCCLYFKAMKAPNNSENILYLNGEREGLVNNCCFPSTVSSSYAPVGETLVSVSILGTHDEMSDADLESAVRKELGKWFGSFEVSSWVFLRIYRIPFAQPNQWDKVENKSSIAVYGLGGIAVLYVTSSIVSAVNAIPLLPKLLELVGFIYTAWFVYRYLLFKTSREELSKDVEELKSKITGREDNT